ncbi:MAG: DUF1579 family protein [Ignavibacteriaceae bacterium]
MNAEDRINKFSFLLGKWELKYKVSKTRFSEENYGEGEGEFKKILDNHYVTFEYKAKISGTESSAHAIFAWDEKSNIYRYWWFEDSGQFMEATADFIDEKTLCLNWHNSLLVQTFHKTDDGKIILQMKYPINNENYNPVLEVSLTRR